MNGKRSRPDASHDERSHRRYELESPVPFRLLMDSGLALPVVYVDVSERGLGIFMEKSALKRGDILILDVSPTEHIKLRICWLRENLQHAGLSSYIRVGLSTCSEDVNLLELFRAHGAVET